MTATASLGNNQGHNDSGESGRKLGPDHHTLDFEHEFNGHAEVEWLRDQSSEQRPSRDQRSLWRHLLSSSLLGLALTSGRKFAE
jgi:hypothetical protein